MKSQRNGQKFDAPKQYARVREPAIVHRPMGAAVTLPDSQEHLDIAHEGPTAVGTVGGKGTQAPGPHRTEVARLAEAAKKQKMVL